MSLAFLSTCSPNNSINSNEGFHRRNSRLAQNNNNTSLSSLFVLSSKRRRYKIRHSSGGGHYIRRIERKCPRICLSEAFLIDDIALLGVTLTFTEQSRKLYEIAEGAQPGDVEAPTGAIFALAILVVVASWLPPRLG